MTYPLRSSVCAVIFTVLSGTATNAAVALDALGQYLTGNGYGGAQFILHDNSFRLPVVANGKPANFVIDTGAPTSLVFRESARKLGLAEEKTDYTVKGAFNPAGKDKFGLTRIKSVVAGNCTLANMRVAIASHRQTGRYSSADGLLGLREMGGYNGVIDFGRKLIFMHPRGAGGGIAGGIRSILTQRGYTAIPLSISGAHIRAKGNVNDQPCSFIIDSGASLTLMDQEFTRQAKAMARRTGLEMSGLGSSSRELSVANFSSVKIGDFKLNDTTFGVAPLAAGILDGDERAAGLIGAEYLSRHGAVIDLTSGVLYLRPKK